MNWVGKDGSSGVVTQTNAKKLTMAGTQEQRLQIFEQCYMSLVSSHTAASSWPRNSPL